MKQLLKILVLIAFGYALCFTQNLIYNNSQQKTTRFAIEQAKPSITNRFDKIKTTRARDLGIDLTSIITSDTVKKRGILKRWFGRR